MAKTLIGLVGCVFALAAFAKAALGTVGEIREFGVPTVDSLPFGIAAGPDGNLWFTENAGKKIGRIT